MSQGAGSKEYENHSNGTQKKKIWTCWKVVVTLRKQKRPIE